MTWREREHKSPPAKSPYESEMFDPDPEVNRLVPMPWLYDYFGADPHSTPLTERYFAAIYWAFTTMTTCGKAVQA